jgi:tRNA modification GTPase
LIDERSRVEGPDAAVPTWLVRNKIDVASPGEGVTASRASTPSFRISAKRGDGVADLVAAIVGFAETYFGVNDSALISRERQRKLLDETAAALRRGLRVIGEGEELAAEELRAASMSLGRLLGRVDIEDILDVIFREFCIGK